MRPPLPTSVRSIQRTQKPLTKNVGGVSRSPGAEGRGSRRESCQARACSQKTWGKAVKLTPVDTCWPHILTKKIRCARPASQGVSPLSGRTSPRLPVHWLCGPPLACAADWPLCRVALVSYFLGLCKSRNWFLSFFLRRRKQIGCHNTSCQIARYLTFCTTVYVTNTHNRIYGKV